jgi:hypothetical protein
MGALSVAAEATVACNRVLRFMLSPVLVLKMTCENDACLIQGLINAGIGLAEK